MDSNPPSAGEHAAGRMRALEKRVAALEARLDAPARPTREEALVALRVVEHALCRLDLVDQLNGREDTGETGVAVTTLRAYLEGDG